MLRLTKKEVDLLMGMMEVQLVHADRCDILPNKKITRKQKTRDIQRYALLKKVLDNSLIVDE